MEPPKVKGDTGCAIYVDMGTTNTRVWLARDDEVLARAQAQVGVRDAARDRSSARLRAALRELILGIRGPGNHPNCAPACVIAAGMITSPLGLVEVPHVAAPAGLTEIAAAVERHHFPDVTDLPVLLVPGVRSGPAHRELGTVGATDVIRGEETLCVGLAALGLLGVNATLLNLGSHWKAIRLDRHQRITSSVTSLSGELIHAAQTQTILASAVPPSRPAALDQKWVEAGIEQQRRSSLPRALFCVRLLEQGSESTPAERLAYLVGAFLAADLDGLIREGLLSVDAPVVITGGGALAEAWQRALSQVSISATALSEVEVERALLRGLRCVTAAAPSLF